MNRLLSQKESGALRKELTMNQRIAIIEESNGSMNTVNDILRRKRKLCKSYQPHFKALVKKALQNNTENRKTLIELYESLRSKI